MATQAGWLQRVGERPGQDRDPTVVLGKRDERPELRDRDRGWKAGK